MKCVRMIVSGRVQGVWYRAHTRDKATELGLAGYVRNLPDGTVEIVARGEDHQIDAMERWARSGPPAASVVAVDVAEHTNGEDFTGFAVRY